MQNTKTIKDRHGLPLSTVSPTAADHYIEGLDLMLAQGYGPEDRFQQAIDADDGFALAHGALAVMLAYRIRIPEAKESAKRARSLVNNITSREGQTIRAISLMIDGSGPDALALIREHLVEYPRDALMLRLATRLFLLGCSGAGVANFPEELLALLKTVESDYGDDWAFLGQFAFAHHETGYFDESLRLAQRSLEMRPDNANASHSVAHVFFETGDAAGGTDFLADWLQGYDKRAPFHVHLSWHEALFELATGHYDRATALYESVIRPSVVAKNLGTLADSASLMWRMRIYGDAEPSTSWAEVREIAMPAVEKPGPPFRDAHAALVFAAAGYTDEMGRMLDGLKAAADNGDPLAREVTLPLIKGIDAFANGAYEDAVEFLEPAFANLPRIGGSHAQREVFEDTLLEAYIRAGQFDGATNLLNTRLKRRTSPRDMFWLGRTQARPQRPSTV
jgi:tetratricopeptide (TPR) repeat protein